MPLAMGNPGQLTDEAIKVTPLPYILHTHSIAYSIAHSIALVQSERGIEQQSKLRYG